MLEVLRRIMRESACPSETRTQTLKRRVAASRVLLFRPLLAQLRELSFMDEFLAAHAERDTFFFLTHNHYLSKRFSLRERVAVAIHHYRHERQTFDEDYRKSVYEGDGLSLWRSQQEQHHFCIRLVTTDDNRYEGDLSVLLDVNGVSVCRLSYSVVSGAIFGLADQAMIFITRNQTARGAELDLFRSVFKNNSPQYFCLAAIAGIGMTSGMHAMAAIRSEAQIAYAPQYHEGFENSYGGFWAQFGAKDLDAQAMLLDVPPALPELSEVKSKHRARALTRRAYWGEIILAVQDALGSHRLQAVVAFRNAGLPASFAPAAPGQIPTL